MTAAIIAAKIRAGRVRASSITTSELMTLVEAVERLGEVTDALEECEIDHVSDCDAAYGCVKPCTCGVERVRPGLTAHRQEFEARCPVARDHQASVEAMSARAPVVASQASVDVDSMSAWALLPLTRTAALEYRIADLERLWRRAGLAL